MTGTADERTFEQAFSELKAAVDALDGGNLTMEESTQWFKHGIELATLCNELLAKAEMQIDSLQHNFGEEMAKLQLKSESP